MQSSQKDAQSTGWEYRAKFLGEVTTKSTDRGLSEAESIRGTSSIKIDHATAGQLTD